MDGILASHKTLGIRQGGKRFDYNDVVSESGHRLFALNSLTHCFLETLHLLQAVSPSMVNARLIPNANCVKLGLC